MNHRVLSFGSCLAIGLFVLSGCATDASNLGRQEVGHVRGKMHVVAEGADGCPVCAIYDRARESTVRIRSKGGLGTGVVVASNGRIVTNAHVVGEESTVIVETVHGTIVKATVEKSLKDEDLALLSTAADDVRWTMLAHGAAGLPRIGSPIFVIGHPASLGWTITEGIVSGHRKPGEVASTAILQVDAAVSPGNSGGPVLDSSGNWIGVVSSKLVGPGLENISFVIPRDDVRAKLGIE
ncbi:MAG: serine protease [Phycisphaerales bacterium]|nr:serine protease [Phycisphaerales bacterium]